MHCVKHEIQHSVAEVHYNFIGFTDDLISKFLGNNSSTISQCGRYSIHFILAYWRHVAGIGIISYSRLALYSTVDHNLALASNWNDIVSLLRSEREKVSEPRILVPRIFFRI